MANANLPIFESLENRRLLSTTIVEQVLGIATPSSAPAFVFIPNPNIVFAITPDVQGVYSGNFTLGNGATGTIAVDVISQNLNTIFGTAQLTFKGTTFNIRSATGHINRHGGFSVQGSGTALGIAFTFQGAGHLNIMTTQIASGGFSFADSLGQVHIGTFSLTKTF